MKHSQRKTKTYWKVNGGNRSYRSFDSHSLEATPQLTSDFRPSGDDAVNRRASPKLPRLFSPEESEGIPIC
jgi:hypothetical protein